MKTGCTAGVPATGHLFPNSLSAWSKALLGAVGLAILALPAPVLAQQPIQLPEIEIISTTPQAGAEIRREKVPAVTHVLTAPEVSIEGTPSLLGSLDALVGGVTLN